MIRTGANDRFGDLKVDTAYKIQIAYIDLKKVKHDTAN
jgi:hypothetical protein